MQTNEQKLESVTETVISIPFGGSGARYRDYEIASSSHSPLDDESDFEDEDDDVEGPAFPCRMYTPRESAYRDLPDGPGLRMKAYQEAFTLCRDRMREVLRRLRAPMVRRVLEAVKDTYEVHEEDKLMPYTELRVIAISGSDRSATSAVLGDVRFVLVNSSGIADEVEQEQDGSQLKVPVIVSMLAPSDCSNLTSAMKALVGGFLNAASINERDVIEEGRSRRRLASYDVNLLEMWYDKVKRSKDEENLPKLVILASDLERIDPAVMQDLFYIFSLYVPRLPFVFVLGLSTPPTPSYFHSAFPRNTLALLRLTRIEAPGGLDVLRCALTSTFFDPEFETGIMPSPAVLSFIIEQFTRTAQSMDLALSLLQLVFLRHFIDPLSILAHDELLGTASIEEAAEKLAGPSNHPFLLALLARLRHSEKNIKAFEPLAKGMNRFGDMSATNRLRKTNAVKGKGKATASEDPQTDPKAVLDALRHIRNLRRRHKERLRASRVAFHVVSEIRNQLLGAGKIDEDARLTGGVGTELDLMRAWLRGTVPGREGKVFIKGIRDLQFELYRQLIYSLEGVFGKWSAGSIAEDDRKQLFARWIRELDALDLDPDAAAGGLVEAKDEMCEWLHEYLSETAFDFTETELWDIWFTGNPTGIEELINPAPRVAIINALVHPERYIGYTDTEGGPSSKLGTENERAGNSARGDGDGGNLIPDTALLFKGYLESGRMVNVYDWYMSFQEGLDARNRSERAVEERSRAGTRGKRDRRSAVRRLGPRDRARSMSPSPTKGRGRGRERGMRGRGRGGRLGKHGERPNTAPESNSDGDENETGDEEDVNPEEHERWEAEVQARFIRSVQELDLLGFIKHTGRKADHVQKTVYDLPDYT